MTEERGVEGRRYAAVLEVVLVVSGTLALVGLVANSTCAARQSAAAGRPFLEYLTLMAVPVAVLLATRRRLQTYGLTVRRFRRSAYGALVCMLPYGAAHAVLALVTVGPMLAAAVRTVLAVAVLVLAARWLPRVGPAPLVLGVAVPAFLLSFDVAAGAVLAAGFHILFLGPGEEILFRGYVQTRLNAAFGRPWVYRGVRFGWGLPLAAVLFGVFHLLNLPRLHAGEIDLAWGAGVAAVAWGLFFGYLREWSGSVVTPALVHGVPQGIAEAVLG